jgi:hypothetical protein
VFKIYLDIGFLPIYNVDMPKRSRKNGLDLNQLASYIVNEATDGDLLNKAIKEGKNPAAVMLGRLGGLKGGKANKPPSNFLQISK